MIISSESAFCLTLNEVQDCCEELLSSVNATLLYSSVVSITTLFLIWNITTELPNIEEAKHVIDLNFQTMSKPFRNVSLKYKCCRMCILNTYIFVESIIQTMGKFDHQCAVQWSNAVIRIPFRLGFFGYCSPKSTKLLL